MKILMVLFFLSISSISSFAAYQISCPSKGITALNQTNQYTTQTTVNGTIVNKTVIYDVPYFDQLFNATDCTINQVADSSVYVPLTPAQIAAQKQAAQIQSQIQANRDAYVDALIAGDTATQKSIATAQAALIVQKATIK